MPMSSTVGQRVFAVWETDFELIQKCGGVPIRLRCCDKLFHERQLIEISGMSAYFAGESMECYADRKPELRIICGSV
jgi:hypothetical protein